MTFSIITKYIIEEQSYIHIYIWSICQEIIIIMQLVPVVVFPRMLPAAMSESLKHTGDTPPKRKASIQRVSKQQTCIS
jgi:hypothetical protein